MRHQAILDVRKLKVAFEMDGRQSLAVNGVDLSLEKGRILGLAGESGCGKSVTAMSILQLLPKPAARILEGEILFDYRDLLSLPVSELRKIRGKRISMIFQEPMTALNPVHHIQRQMVEVYRLHSGDLKPSEMVARSVEMLRRVDIPAPVQTMKKYPHQLSGGMRQRVLIAMALACEPEILIADEPTTAVDVTVQAQILDLIRHFQKKNRMSVLLITHDLGVIAENCDDVGVMYAGQIVEKADTQNLFRHPAHPYTRGLMTSIPALARHPKTRLPSVSGQIAPLETLGSGCKFALRCHMVDEICRKLNPQLRIISQNHSVACHLA